MTATDADRPRPPRVFVIGFNKCGTRTLHWYFKSNGYKSVHWDHGKLALAIFRNLSDSAPLLTGYEDYTIFSDMENIVRDTFAFEAYKLYPYFSAQYPDSVFILNTRNVDKWIKSRFEHGNGSYAKKWREIVHAADDEELIARWRQDWDRHHENVERFFALNPHRFLKFDIDTDGAEKLNAALPEYRLDPAHYATRGRTKGHQKKDGLSEPAA